MRRQIRAKKGAIVMTVRKYVANLSRAAGIEEFTVFRQTWRSRSPKWPGYTF